MKVYMGPVDSPIIFESGGISFSHIDPSMRIDRGERYGRYVNSCPSTSHAVELWHDSQDVVAVWCKELVE